MVTSSCVSVSTKYQQCQRGGPLANFRNCATTTNLTRPRVTFLASVNRVAMWVHPRGVSAVRVVVGGLWCLTLTRELVGGGLGLVAAANVTLVDVMTAGETSLNCTEKPCTYAAFRIPGLVAFTGKSGEDTLLAFAEGRKTGCGDFDGQVGGGPTRVAILCCTTLSRTLLGILVFSV